MTWQEKRDLRCLLKTAQSELLDYKMTLVVDTGLTKRTWRLMRLGLELHTMSQTLNL